MENISPNLPLSNKKDFKKNFIQKIPNKINYPKGNLQTCYIKLPMHVQKHIFEFFNQKEQIDYSLINKKFFRLFDICSYEKESLILNKTELPENYLYFVFSKLANFKNVKKLYLHNITLNDTLLDFLYQLDFKNVKKLKAFNCRFIAEPEKSPISYGMEYSYGYGFSYANSFKIGLKLFEFIQKVTTYETFYLENFRFCIGQRELTFSIPAFFPQGLPKLKKLVMKNCNLTGVRNVNLANDIDKRFPNLEVIDFSDNHINSNFFDDAILALFFPNSEKIKKVNFDNCQMNLNSIRFTYLQNFNNYNTRFKRSYPNYKLLNLSRNNANSEGLFEEHEELLKKIYPNLHIQKDNLNISPPIQLMRMLFSRSAVIKDQNSEAEANNYQKRLINDNSNFDFINQINFASSVNRNNYINFDSKNKLDLFGNLDSFDNSYEKYLDKKPNDAVLPCLIYKQSPKLNFDKASLIKILKTENELRLSNESKTLYDQNALGEATFHLNLDQSLIRKALKINGFNPEKDDSLKAYHVATRKYAIFPEINQSVVWMKYDKCKIGKYSIGDTVDFKKIKLFDLEKNEIFLSCLLNKNKKAFNLIVSGSLS